MTKKISGFSGTLRVFFLLIIAIFCYSQLFAQKTSEPPESMGDFFRENFPLESTLKQIDADIASNPGNPALWQTRATLLESHGKTDEALLALEKALALIPEPAASQPNQKGKVRIVTGHNYAGALFDIAKIYLAMNRREEARKTLQRAVQGDSPHMMACTYLGNIFLDEGNSAEALKYYNLMGHNLSTSGKISKGNALYNLKRYDEAIAEYKVAAHWKPELPSVLRHLGDAYLRAGRYADALNLYQRYVKAARQKKIPESEIAPVISRLEQLKKQPKAGSAKQD